MHYEGGAQGVFPGSCIRVEIAMGPAVVEAVVCDPAACLPIWLDMHAVDWVHETILGTECFNIWAASRGLPAPEGVDDVSDLSIRVGWK